MIGENRLSASQEDYLEAIFQVSDDDGRARVKDVASHLHVAASSVTSAVSGLAARGLVEHAPYADISLTPSGAEHAQEVVRRHEALADFFRDVLSIDGAEAAACACRMEHAISDVVLERLVKFIEYEKRCSRGRTRWVEGTGFMCQRRRDAAGECGMCGV
jgi:DtxR family Mn-dependent transcriptional regulator